ncbi:MAG TPA: ArsA family ATPase [Dehalococcoidia bacterium]|nr:ArsA family ATPase [Dehalococcoidia bacterium]
MGRIILYTGKGGVGKTTISAATALRAAEMGHRTVVLSTDAAHSLADSFDTPLGPEPTQVGDNLWAQESDVYFNIKNWWGIVQEWLTALLVWQGMQEMEAEEVAVLPGMEELANLLWITRHYESGKFDTVIVDCAPTGQALTLLSFPEAARWWVDKVLPVERRLAKIAGPVVRGLTGMPVPNKPVFDAAEELAGHLAELHDLLSDREVSTVRLVVNPEKMVIKEAQRSFTYLNLYGYVTDAVVCNRLLPEAVADSYFARWQTAQRKYRRQIEEAFSPLPVLTAPLLEHEVVGVEGLRDLAQRLFGDDDPTHIYYQAVAQEVRTQDSEYVLSLAMPFVEREEISLAQRGDELSIKVGSYERQVLLPRALAGRRAVSAKMDGDRLTISFAKGE